MKKSTPATTFVAFPLLAKTTRLRTYGCIAIVLLAGCTATQVRWDATKMREDVMVYYNDQIMDNLIREKNHLPFVHVDINLLTSTGGSQISGTIGAGETRTHTDSPPSMIGALSSITKAVTRPFAYSVTPQQTETLTISAVPALGSQAMESPTPEPNEPSEPPVKPPTWEETKKTIETETWSADGKIRTWSKTESTKKPPKRNPPRTIYDLYHDFARDYVKQSPTRPSKDHVLPGTVIKWWNTNYYYIDKNATANCKNAGDAYYDFCKALFTKGQQGQTGSLEKALQQTQAQSAAGLR